MYYCIAVFVSAVLVILTMLFVGAKVNKKKITHDYYAEKISEERVKVAVFVSAVLVILTMLFVGAKVNK